MRCYDCKCNFCANSVELGPPYMTPGEADFPCFTCDECRHYDGDWKKSIQWRPDCERYKKPAKKTEMERLASDQEAERRRRQLRVMKGGKRVDIAGLHQKGVADRH